MDFAAGLANLEQAADNSRNNNNDRRRGRDNNYHGGGDDRRYQPRPRHHYDNNRNYGRQDHHHRGNHRHQQQDRALDGLIRYGYRLPRNAYHRPSPIPQKSDRPLHVCLLAITIDDLPYEAIWRAWARSSKNPRYVTSLLCHAKFPDQVKSDWLKQRLLLQPRRIVRGNSLSDPEYLSHKPAWGSVEITRAMVDLLDQGMQMGKRATKPDEDARFSPNRFFMGTSKDIPPADKFIFISETCVPVTTLDECMEQLFPAAKPPQGTDSSAPRWVPPPAKEEPKKEEKQDNWDNEDDDDKKNKEDTLKKEEPTKQPINPADLPINRKKREEEAVVYLDTSWVNARNFNSPNTPQNKYERDQFNNIHRVVPKRYRWKADQWMVLSRTHAAMVLEIDHSSNLPSKDQLWSCFRRINASDEMYFPTTLSLAGVLVDPTHNHNHNNYNHTYHVDKPQEQDSSSSPWLERRQVTYTDWSMGMRNPASFTKGIRDFANIARLARGKKCLLARKFCPYLEIPGKDASELERTGDISVEEWRKEMATIRKFENGGVDDSGSGADEDKKEEEEDNSNNGEEAKEEEDDGAEKEEEQNEGDQKEEEETGDQEEEEGGDEKEDGENDDDDDDGNKEEEEEEAKADDKDDDDDDSDSESNMHSFLP